MEWFIAVLAIVLLGVAAMAAAGGMGEMSKEPVRDIYRQQLPDRLLTANDLQHVRFGVTLRGYAMSQVDDLLDRLGREIAERDQRISDLTSRVAPTAAVAPELPNGSQPPVAVAMDLPNGSHFPAPVPPELPQPYVGEETGQR